ncbi:MAG: hypothetical protein HC831_16295 [Chloroflexia bacterium]|nr:hypothetical protein [Chloroflexia bacterium]
MDNILLQSFKQDGDIRHFHECVPQLGKKFPQSIQIDASGTISWSHFELKDYSSDILTVKTTTIDLFQVIAEQQLRIDELTDKLNIIIKYLK